MSLNKQKIKKGFQFFTGILILIILIFITFRNELLNQVIEKISMRMETNYNSTFSIKKASFNGLFSVNLTEVVLAPKDNDTLLKIKKIKASISGLDLLKGNLQLTNLEINNGFIQLTKNKETSNFKRFFNKKNELENNSEDTKNNYASIINHFISKTFGLISEKMFVNNLILKLNDNNKKASVTIPKMTLINNKIDVTMNVVANNFIQHWGITGFADSYNKKIAIKFFNRDTGAIQMPYLDERYNLKLKFDTINLTLNNNNKANLEGNAGIINLMVNHPKIASKDVLIEKASFNYNLLLNNNLIAIDSSSTIQLNQITFKPYIAYNTEKDTIYTLKLKIPKMPAQNFINSLPSGLFNHFNGMKTEGNFDFNLDFQYNKNKPSALIFNTKLNKENLKINQYGEANLNKLNGEFVYRAVIKNVLQRPVLVGNANPNYTPLNNISPYLTKCILTTEDPSFFNHKGFINLAFKQSIIKNIKTKKFTRGASTITMQLIKNVFLTREKTLSRKLEEILLVYILENNKIVSKQRMLEVYLNIIEWGPNIYGIGEASYFYFNKPPLDLNLSECLYLARIIPSPKKFMLQFDETGALKSYALKQQNLLINMMTKRGVLSQTDSISKIQNVLLTGRAKTFLNLKIKDITKIEVDSLISTPLEF